ncbi:hypothetical protein Lpp221_15608 [Lacticaseibacillus paracasei subsp. paracasei Lpp221]|nr:hypothetical protein A3778_07460 [Lacticaseibacillus paracasei]EPC76769.1 hypothetical protein Lpp221_15608 [Lacticaseibacillus paracasei subsp. paracasei Lpp221]OUC69763.1 hypothetical protein B4Q23_2906c [Lacticaseibacillus paracasei]
MLALWSLNQDIFNDLRCQQPTTMLLMILSKQSLAKMAIASGIINSTRTNTFASFKSEYASADQ